MSSKKSLSPHFLEHIHIQKACEHNLKNVDLILPRNKFIVITGVSGSGKSSLAFDTIFAEGQRKYMESLSSYARQFLKQAQKAKVEHINGLPPTIAIEQRASSHNPRSTVATTTEIYDYLRLLFARCGTPRCWHKESPSQKACLHLVERQSPLDITEALLKHEGKKAILLAPIVVGKKGFHKDILIQLQKQGLVRARVDGKLIDLYEDVSDNEENPFSLKRYEAHTIEAVLNRLVLKKDKKTQLLDSIESTLKLGKGRLKVLLIGENSKEQELLFCEDFACPLHSEASLQELEPRLFSFNSPFGSCRDCSGLGYKQQFDLNLILDPKKSVADGAFIAFKWLGSMYQRFYKRVLTSFCKKLGVDKKTPFEDLAPSDQEALLYGDQGRLKKGFNGVIPLLQTRYVETDNEKIRLKLEQLQSHTICPTCQGARLKTEALFVFLESPKMPSFNISQIIAMTVEDALHFFQNLKLSKEKASIAEPILKEVTSRLLFLSSVGLNYLNLNRLTASLSGGEAQRIRLATQIGTGLVGVCYVLDEPTIGLHPRDNHQLIKTLKNLSTIGNTVIVVEHDEEVILSADYLVDVGPGPGVHGGEIVAHGPIKDFLKNASSLTAKYLNKKLEITPPKLRRDLSNSPKITIYGAKEHNLKNLTVSFPLEGITCVTGVSGSGKSTLVNQILLKALNQKLNDSKEKPGNHECLEGEKGIYRIISVDQSPIGKTPRSNPATYTGLFDHIRQLFSQCKEAKMLGYGPGRFSFNVKGGRCESCQGQGTKKIEMHFLPDTYIECESCQGTRYHQETLEIKYKGKNIADVLNMTVEEALSFFDAHPAIFRILTALHQVGLDYIALGQSSTTLSGGEAQRVKLAAELCKVSQSRSKVPKTTLYILDEPTTGLHFQDIDKLIQVFQNLADLGNALIIIEHNLDVIKCADWLIDLGPEGGDKGGQLIAQGTPEQVAKSKSLTGKYLKPLLRNS